MDRRTRVLNALEKKPVDRVPVGFWYHFDGAEAAGEACVQAHIKYAKDAGVDMIKIMCDGFFPYPVPKNCVTASDWKTLKPLGKDHPFIRDQVWRAKRIVEEAGKDYPIFYNVFAPFSSIRFGAGDERVMADIRKDPPAVMHALDVIAQDNALLAELLIGEAGVDGVYYCVQGGEDGRFTPEEYKSLIMPSDLYVLERANRFSKHNIMHCCGWAGAKNQLALWRDYPVACVNWAVYVEELPLEEGRFFFGNRSCMGGFQSLHREGQTHAGVLHNGTKEEVQAFTRGTILSFGKTGLLLGADCTVNAGIAHERIRWVAEAAATV